MKEKESCYCCTICKGLHLYK